MTNKVPASHIEEIVGKPRHPTMHWGINYEDTGVFYILHSQRCLEKYEDLRQCPASLALDAGLSEELQNCFNTAVFIAFDPIEKGLSWLH